MAAEGSGERASVLIELDLPPQQVQVAASRHRPGEMPKRQFVEETAEELEAAKNTVQQAGEFLKNTLGETPHWLRAARAYVADVTSDQLRTLAGSPLIKTIRLNRRINPGA